MALSVNVTIAMPPEMVERLDEEAEQRGMSRAEYVRRLVQQAEDSPFDQPTTAEADEKGAA